MPPRNMGCVALGGGDADGAWGSGPGRGAARGPGVLGGGGGPGGGGVEALVEMPVEAGPYTAS
jgi:hypothetical protein